MIALCYSSVRLHCLLFFLSITITLFQSLCVVHICFNSKRILVILDFTLITFSVHSECAESDRFASVEIWQIDSLSHFSRLSSNSSQVSHNVFPTNFAPFTIHLHALLSFVLVFPFAFHHSILALTPAIFPSLYLALHTYKHTPFGTLFDIYPSNFDRFVYSSARHLNPKRSRFVWKCGSIRLLARVPR